MAMTCFKCGHVEEDAGSTTAHECQNCGAVYAKVRAAMRSGKLMQRPAMSNAKTSSIRMRNALYASIAILFIICLFFGSFHVITGSHVGTMVVTKYSFGYSETFINTDRIIGMPWIAAKAQYPLSVKVLQREKILESDAAREARIQDEISARMEEARSETERAMRRAQEDMERFMRKSGY
jgi:predicted  nucleic acid-binding Zn-ribbon protein